MYKLVPGMELLQQKIDVFIKGKESHFEDVEDLGDGHQELEENQQGILDSIEDSSNALREKADKIVSTTNASKAVAYSFLKVVGIVVELLATVALLGLVAWNSHRQELAPQGLGYVSPHVTPTETDTPKETDETPKKTTGHVGEMD